MNKVLVFFISALSPSKLLCAVPRLTSVSFMALLLLLSVGCASKQGEADNGSYLHVRAKEARAEGVSAYAKGEFSLALRMFNSALQIDRALDDKDSEVIDLINTARVSIALENFSGAEVLLNDAIKTSIDAKSVKNRAAAYATLAKLEYLSGRLNSALSHVEESIEIDRRNRFESGAALNLKGGILAEAGRMEEAYAVLQRALKINISENNSLEQANSYRSLGHLYSLKKHHAKAVEQYTLAYDLDTKAGNSKKIAVDLTSLAALHSKSGQLLKAAYLLERSYIVNLNSGRQLEAIANLTQLVRTYDKLGNKDKAGYFIKIKSTLIKSYEEGRLVNITEKN